MCWPETRGGLIIELPCTSSDSSFRAQRYCGINGKWEQLSDAFIHQYTQRFLDKYIVYKLYFK